MHPQRLATALLAALAFLLVAACGEPVEELEPTYTYERGQAVCDGSLAAPEAAVFPAVETIGTSANSLSQAGGYLWMVESGDNTVSRYDLSSGRHEPNFIDVTNDRNPWEAYVDEELGLVYVTNYTANTLSVASASTGELLEEIGQDQPVFDAPEGITATADHIYVTNTAYRGPNDYAQGFVLVLDRRTREVVGRIDTAHPNPQYVRALDTPEGHILLVVNTGRLEATNEGAFVRTDGSVELWVETDEPAEPAREIFTLSQTDDPRMGAPGRPVITPDGRYLYLPSATAPTLFKLDLRERAWVHDTQSPIELYEASGDTTHNLTIDRRGVLYVTALNTDRMYLVDTACDEVLAGPFELGTTASRTEGPQDVRIVETKQGPKAFFITTLSSALGVVELGYQ